MTTTNAKVILDFVNEVADLSPDRDLALSLDWFRWVMEQAHMAEECAQVINPDWFRANGRILSMHGDKEPQAMFMDLGEKTVTVQKVELNEKTHTDWE